MSLVLREKVLSRCFFPLFGVDGYTPGTTSTNGRPIRGDKPFVLALLRSQARRVRSQSIRLSSTFMNLEDSAVPTS